VKRLEAKKEREGGRETNFESLSDELMEPWDEGIDQPS
jgi:hypothetical protein